jgi:hypothetical protein
LLAHSAGVGATMFLPEGLPTQAAKQKNTFTILRMNDLHFQFRLDGSI